MDGSLLSVHLCEESRGKLHCGSIFVPLVQIQSPGESGRLLEQHGVLHSSVVKCAFVGNNLGVVSMLQRCPRRKRKVLLFEWNFDVSIKMPRILCCIAQASCHRHLVHWIKCSGLPRRGEGHGADSTPDVLCTPDQICTQTKTELVEMDGIWPRG